MSDRFDRSIVESTAHRPWPLPSTPWLMTQSWHDLLFAHWPVDASQIRQAVPKVFDLDLFDREAWLSIVPCYMTNVGIRAAPPLPWLSTFPELNVRTYVRVSGRPGVYFFSLDAGRRLAVAAARALLNLPYRAAVMSGDRSLSDRYPAPRRATGIDSRGLGIVHGPRSHTVAEAHRTVAALRGGRQRPSYAGGCSHYRSVCRLVRRVPSRASGKSNGSSHGPPVGVDTAESPSS
jgi:hypothetical protein